MMATFICHRCRRITVGYVCQCPRQTVERREVVRAERITIRPMSSRWERFKRFVRQLFGREHVAKQRKRKGSIYEVDVKDDDKHSR